MLIAVRMAVVVAQKPVAGVSKAPTGCTGYRQLVGAEYQLLRNLAVYTDSYYHVCTKYSVPCIAILRYGYLCTDSDTTTTNISSYETQHFAQLLSA